MNSLLSISIVTGSRNGFGVSMYSLVVGVVDGRGRRENVVVGSVVVSLRLVDVSPLPDVVDKLCVVEAED